MNEETASHSGTPSSIASQVLSLAWLGLATFAVTFGVVLLLGFVLAGVAYPFVRGLHWSYAAAALLLIVIEAGIAGGLLGFKWALALGTGRLLKTVRFGSRLTHLVFDRAIGYVRGESAPAAGPATDAEETSPSADLQHVPAAKAEAAISNAVAKVDREDREVGWLRRKSKSFILFAVARYALARIRAGKTSGHDVDLVEIRQSLEYTVDEMLINRVQQGLLLWSIGMVVCLITLAALQTTAFVYFFTPPAP